MGLNANLYVYAVKSYRFNGSGVSDLNSAFPVRFLWSRRTVTIAAIIQINMTKAVTIQAMTMPKIEPASSSSFCPSSLGVSPTCKSYLNNNSTMYSLEHFPFSSRYPSSHCTHFISSLSHEMQLEIPQSVSSISRIVKTSYYNLLSVQVPL